MSLRNPLRPDLVVCLFCGEEFKANKMGMVRAWCEDCQRKRLKEYQRNRPRIKRARVKEEVKKGKRKRCSRPECNRPVGDGLRFLCQECYRENYNVVGDEDVFYH